MRHHRPVRLQHIAGIGVDRMGSIADHADVDLLRLENLDTDIPPTAEALAFTREAIERDSANSYLPFVGQDRLRASAAAHVSALSGQRFTADQVVSAGLRHSEHAACHRRDRRRSDRHRSDLRGPAEPRPPGGVPRQVPFAFTPGGEWKLDRAAGGNRPENAGHAADVAVDAFGRYLRRVRMATDREPVCSTICC